MKIRTEIIIDASRNKVWSIFCDARKKTGWQPALKSHTHKSGNPSHPGAVAELIYDENGRQVVIRETILECREPSFLAGSYVSKWAMTLIVNHFEVVDQDTTRWVGYSNFSFKGFMKLMAVFTRGSIQERIEADMDRFKLLVETELSDS